MSRATPGREEAECRDRSEDAGEPTRGTPPSKERHGGVANPCPEERDAGVPHVRIPGGPGRASVEALSSAYSPRAGLSAWQFGSALHMTRTGLCNVRVKRTAVAPCLH